MSVTPEKKPSEIILEKLSQMEQEIKELKQTQTTSTSETHNKAHSEKDLFDCPTCGAKYLEEAKKRLAPTLKTELKPELLKEVKAKLKSKDLVTCDGCGEIVEKTEPECPTCHGKHAH